MLDRRFSVSAPSPKEASDPPIVVIGPTGYPPKRATTITNEKNTTRLQISKICLQSCTPCNFHRMDIFPSMIYSIRQSERFSANLKVKANRRLQVLLRLFLASQFIFRPHLDIISLWVCSKHLLQVVALQAYFACHI